MCKYIQLYEPYANIWKGLCSLTHTFLDVLIMSFCLNPTFYSFLSDIRSAILITDRPLRGIPALAGDNHGLPSTPGRCHSHTGGTWLLSHCTRPGIKIFSWMRRMKKINIEQCAIVLTPITCRMLRALLQTWMGNTSWRWTRWTNRTPTVWTAACTRGSATQSWRTSIALLAQIKQVPLSCQPPVLLSQQQKEVQHLEVQQGEVQQGMAAQQPQEHQLEVQQSKEQLEAQRLELRPPGAAQLTAQLELQQGAQVEAQP